MLTLTASYTGQKELEAALVKFPERAKEFFGPAALKSAKALANKIRDSQRTPVDTGTMINKTAARKLGPLNAVMEVSTKYAAIVHEGIPDDVDITPGVNVFIPSVGWRHINVIKARKGRPFVQWALDDGAQKTIDDIMGEAALQILK